MITDVDLLIDLGDDRWLIVAAGDEIPANVLHLPRAPRHHPEDAPAPRRRR